jgi:predicted PurR-regulated permease PerM
VDRLQRRGWRRTAATLAAMTGAVLFIVLSCLAAILLTLGPLTEVVQTAAAGASQLDLGWLSQAVSEAGGGLQVDLGGVFLDFVGLGLAMLLALLMTFFFLRDGRTWWRAAIERLTPGRRELIGEAGGRAVGLLAGYMIGTAIISAFGGLTTGLILVVLGLPLALPIAVIGFYTGFIPYLGSFITTALALLVTVALGTTSDIVIMLVFTVVFNIAQGNFVTPIVYGKSLSLHPAIVLMAIPVGNEIAGVLGMFLVVPAAAMVAATWRLVIRAIDTPGSATDSPADAPGPDAPMASSGMVTDPDTIAPVPSGA